MRKQVLPMHRGLSLLLGTALGFVDEVQANCAQLNEHPFQLDTKIGTQHLPKSAWESARTVYLIGNPCFFDDGLNNLVKLARCQAGGPTDSKYNPFRYVRKVSTPDNVNAPGTGKIIRMYEIGTNYGVFIAGGIVEYGGGRWQYDSDQMDAMFGFISMMFGVPFDEHIELVMDIEALGAKLQKTWDRKLQQTAAAA